MKEWQYWGSHRTGGVAVLVASQYRRSDGNEGVAILEELWDWKNDQD